MSERGNWAELRGRRMADPDARSAYEAAQAAYAIGEAVKQMRMARGWTQKELGKHARLTQSAVARLEAGDVEPSLRVLAKVAKAFETELEVSFRGSSGSAVTIASGKLRHC